MAGKQMMIVQEYLSQHSPIETINGNDAFRAMKAYAKQQQEIAVEKALEIVINKIKMDFVISCGSSFCEIYCVKVPEQSILSLKQEILKELEK